MIVWRLNIKPIFHLVRYVVNLKRGELKPVASVLGREEGQSHVEIMLLRYANPVSASFLFPYGVRDKVVGLSALGNVPTNI